jgi:alpha/beta superfamily hydrolase
MKKVLLFLSFICCSFSLFAQEIVGQWNGMLKANEKPLRISFNISSTEKGLSATMDSPDQGAKGIPTSSVSFDNNKLKITADALKMTYEGTLAGGKISGTFKQGAYTIPLELIRGEVSIERQKRSQEPQAPFPYYTEEVIFKNGNAGIMLSGTLSLPAKEGNYPVAILISGSGPQNRDEELMGHKPFLVIADYLTKNGFAVLRYDDRGVAQSKGDFKTATSADFADDVAAAIEFLKKRKEINPKKIGLIGHSEGGFIAPMVAARNKDVAFIISLAGPGIPCSDLLVLQGAMISKASGMKQDEVDKNKKINKGAYDLVKKSSSDEILRNNLSTYFSKNISDSDAAKEGLKKEEFIEAEVAQLSSPWMMFFIKYNPASDWQKVHCPVLALNGERDLQVPPKENIDGIKAALAKAGNKNVTTKILPKLNHLFQECTKGLPSEYSKIEQTFSPIALGEMLSWLKTQTK